MRSLVISLVTLLLLVYPAWAAPGTANPAAAEQEILWVAGAPLKSVHPVRVTSGYLLVPAVDTFAPLGVEVIPQGAGQDNPGQTARLELRRGEQRLVVGAGQLDAELNGKPYRLHVAPVREAGVWFVPLAGVASALGLQLTWDDQAGRLLLEAPGQPAAVQPASRPSPLPGAGHGGAAQGKRSGQQSDQAGVARLQVLLLQEAGLASLRLVAPVQFEVRVVPAKGAGEKEKPATTRVDIEIEGLQPGTKVAIPAILPGQWPSPFVSLSVQTDGTAAGTSEQKARLGVELDSRFRLITRTGVAEQVGTAEAGVAYRVDLVPQPVQEEKVSLLARLDRLVWQREVGGSARLTLAGSAPRYSFRYQLVKNPSRLLIDLPGTVWTGKETVLDLADPDFTRLTISQPQPDQARITLDLRHPGYPSVRQDDVTGDLLMDILRVVEEINLRTLSGQPVEQVQVTIQSSGPVEARAYVLPTPERLVVDLSGAALVGAGAKISEQANSLVNRVRVAQFNPRTVRVVLELARPLEVKVNQVGDGSRVELFLSPSPPAPAPGSGAQAGGSQPATAATTTVTWLQRWQAQEVQGELPFKAVATAAVGDSLFAGWSETLAQILSAVSVSGQGGGEGAHPGATEVSLSKIAGIKALAGRTIVIDPGHGGDDPGTIGVNGAREKDLALAISLRLAAVLRQSGARVILTRETDVKPEWEERTAPANLNQADALLSIHLNSSPGRVPEPRGVEVYYHSQRPGADQLAQAVLRGLTTVLKVPARRLEAWDDLRVLKGSTVPGVLVEVGYLTNPEEAEKLVTPEYQELIVEGLVTGLSQYFASRQSKAGQ
ncbi:MAG: N-acetylmuramoyl-L-alanine amidase [Limnochordales bacterium]|nr:N-acetylmuramoyl-L-alanine amidase [Limnochordales bacterium]